MARAVPWIGVGGEGEGEVDVDRLTIQWPSGPVRCPRSMVAESLVTVRVVDVKSAWHP
jgi:hypothetical protein